MFPEDQLKGSLNTVDRQLLYDIREELRKMNQTLSNLSAPEFKLIQDKPKGKRGVIGDS
jgi:hypothetical protein